MGILSNSKRKKKPVDYSKFLDFANNKESNLIEVPTLQSNANDLTKSKLSEFINESVTWTVPTLPPNNLDLYTFDKVCELSQIYVSFYTDTKTGNGITFTVSIKRAGVVLFSFDIDYLNSRDNTNIVKDEKIFNSLIIQAGDKININTISFYTPVGATNTIEIKAIIN